MKLFFAGLVITTALSGVSASGQPAVTSSATVNPPAASASVSGETTQAVNPVNRPPVSLRIVGSNLMNPQGQYLGRIEEGTLNSSNQLEFALIATAYPTNDLVLTPVPWSMLSYVWDQSKAGGTPGAVQTFLAPLDKFKLEQAPKISRTHRTDLPPDWVQKVYAFYGALPGAIGASGSATASTSGGASGGTATAAGTTTTPSGVAVGAGEGVAVPPVVYTDPGGGVLIGFPVTNAVTNTLLPTNVVSSNIFVGGSNVFVGGSNIFAGGSNVFAGGTNLFTGGTGSSNVSPGATAPVTDTNVPPGVVSPPNTVQGSNAAQVGRPPSGTFAPGDANRARDNSGASSTVNSQSAPPPQNAPQTTTPGGTATPRSAPAAPAAGRK